MQPALEAEGDAASAQVGEEEEEAAAAAEGGAAAAACRIGLMLDLDAGSLSVYKNDVRLGSMVDGRWAENSPMTGEYCWAVSTRERGEPTHTQHTRSSRAVARCGRAAACGRQAEPPQALWPAHDANTHARAHAHTHICSDTCSDFTLAPAALMLLGGGGNGSSRVWQATASRWRRKALSTSRAAKVDAEPGSGGGRTQSTEPRPPPSAHASAWRRSLRQQTPIDSQFCRSKRSPSCERPVP